MEILLASGILALCGLSAALLILIGILARTHRAIQAQTRRYQASRVAQHRDDEHKPA